MDENQLNLDTRTDNDNNYYFAIFLEWRELRIARVCFTIGAVQKTLLVVVQLLRAR
jgi:hypothetical protein